MAKYSVATILAILIGLTITHQSCKKSEPEFQIYHETVSQNDTLILSWGFGDEEGMKITKEPIHGKYFDMKKSSGYTILTYVPKTDFIGEDMFEYKVTEWLVKTEKTVTRGNYRVIINVVK